MVHTTVYYDLTMQQCANATEQYLDHISQANVAFLTGYCNSLDGQTGLEFQCADEKAKIYSYSDTDCESGKELVQTVEANGNLLCDQTFVGFEGLSLSAMCDIHSGGGGGNDDDDDKNEMMIYILIGAGGVVLILVCLLTAYCVFGKKRSSDKYDKFIDGDDSAKVVINN